MFSVEKHDSGGTKDSGILFSLSQILHLQYKLNNALWKRYGFFY
jgi:hypothetical protein